jgi:hypothetical protein
MSRQAINQSDQKFHVSYVSKIDAIGTYFGISNSAAKYMYHLRRKGFPFLKPDQKDFLPWNTPLQNALVRADKHTTFEWDTLQFGNEKSVLTRFGIEIYTQEQNIFRNYVSQKNASKITSISNARFVNVPDDDGWTLVNTKDKFLTEKRILRSCGFLPSRIRTRKKKYPRKETDGDPAKLNT